jgi:hypothetical protein
MTDYERGYRQGKADRQWVTLDDEEYQEILAKLEDGGLLAFYILIEEKLREKNGLG